MWTSRNRIARIEKTLGIGKKKEPPAVDVFRYPGADGNMLEETRPCPHGPGNIFTLVDKSQIKNIIQVQEHADDI